MITMVNAQNTLRHYIAKGRKALRRNDYDACHGIFEKASDDFLCYRLKCSNCPHDDFSYCGLRNSKLTEQQIFMLHCFPNLLKEFEKTLKNMQNKQER